MAIVLVPLDLFERRTESVEPPDPERATAEAATVVSSVTAAAIKLWNNCSCPRDRGNGQTIGEIAMKTILSALVALAVIAGVAGTANAALDAKTFFEQIDRDHN